MKISLVLCLVMSLIMSCANTDRKIDPKKHQLRINIKKSPHSLDPRLGNDMVASQLHFMLFEGLLKLNPDLSLSYGQAHSYDISENGLIYTFHLKQTYWSDGSMVTAEDFEKSWKSILSPEFPCPDAYLLYAVKNAKKAKHGEVSLNDVGLFVKDSKTFVVELEAPSPHFLQIVASSVLLPVQYCNDQKNKQWSGSSKHFVSNGPFKLKEWKFNEEMILEKNRYYHSSHSIQLNEIIIEMIDSEIAVLHMYASGHFDLIGTPLSFFPSALIHDLEKKQLLSYFPAAMTKFLSFNTQRFPFTNVNIRQALSLAIDRNAITKHITQLNEKAALNIIPPNLLGNFTKALINDADEERAKECFKLGLKELNMDLENLKMLSLMYCSSEINHLIAQELQQRWQSILGVKISLEQVEFSTLHDRSKKADFSIGIFTWLADYGDPMNILERFEDPTNHRNYSKWRSEQYNLLIQKARFAENREEYFKCIRAAEDILIDQAPIACLFHDNYTFLIQPTIKGVEVSSLGHIYFEKIYRDDGTHD